MKSSSSRHKRKKKKVTNHDQRSIRRKDDWMNLAPAGSSPALCQIRLVPGVPCATRLKREVGNCPVTPVVKVHMQVAHDSLSSRSSDRVMQSFLQQYSFVDHASR
jgi:hypothetical protein